MDHPLSPVSPDRFRCARTRRPLEAAWAGAAGVCALLSLAILGRADPWAAVVAAVAVAAAAAYATRQALRAGPAATAANDGLSDRDAPALSQDPPFEAALGALSDPVMIVSGEEPDDLASRRVVYANAAARETLRISGGGALLVSVLRHPEVLEALDEALFGGIAGAIEYETGGVQSRALRAWCAPLGTAPTDPNRRLAVMMLRDETEVRRAQRMNADFLANASHELRTPLASLAGFIETLRGHAKEDPGARERFLAIMAAQAERMGRLIEDLLSLSRIELNEHVPPSGEADLAMAAHDVADALAPQAQARGVTVRVTGDAEAVVEGERDQIVQLVQNLVDNALKYAPAGSEVTAEIRGSLTVSAATEPVRLGAPRLALLSPERSDRRYARVQVTDLGPGVPREHLPRLTERFYRVEGQKSGERSGTGLGLAIVKHIVNRHRGGLLVESLPGAGATFSAYLPQPASAQSANPVANLSSNRHAVIAGAS
jgi:two-component system phosphate regulon sensor histidine kinase PhoR